MNLQNLLPPILYRRLKKANAPLNPLQNHGWKGNYSSWNEAVKQSQGYNQKSILDKVYQSSIRAKNGIVEYERDSVEFEKIEYNWPLLAILLQCQIENGKNLVVLDFGGSLGSTYRQNSKVLQTAGKCTWIIVEQNTFVELGKKEFEDEYLKFEFDIKTAIQKHKPNVILLSSVLQYLENPAQILNEIIGYSIPNVIFDRTSYITGGKERITIQSVPKEIYESSYPCRFFNENHFINYFNRDYTLIYDFHSFCDPDKLSDDNLKFYWKGFYFKKNNPVMDKNP